MTRLACILMLCIAPSISSAQQVRIISGEHAGFSRLVLLYERVPEWRLGRVAGGYEFRPVEPPAGYDTSSVFDYIPRSRIGAIGIRSEGRIHLALACDCHADAFEIREGLVIDIKDGPPGATARFESPLPDWSGTKTGTARSGTRDAPWPAGFDPDLASPRAFETRPRRAPFDWPRLVRGGPDPLAPDMQGDASRDPMPPNRPGDLRSELLSQLGRAMAQGVVEPGEPASSGAAMSSEPGDGPASAPSLPPGLEGLPDNTVIETAIDRGLSETGARRPVAGGDAACLPDGMLDLPAWGTPPENGVAIGRFRADLVGEFDEFDTGKLLALARAYIYLGFGAEALQVLQEIGAGSDPTAHLAAMARALDGMPADPGGAFSAQIACAGRAALWAALAHGDTAAPNAVAADDVIAAFSELPAHLRRHFGPGLAAWFLGHGDDRSATAIRNAVARRSEDGAEGLLAIEAGIALDTGRPSDAASALRSIVDADGTLAADALVRLIDSLVAERAPIAPALRENAAALAFEHRGTALGSELDRAHVRALAHGGDLPGAFDALGDAGARIEASTAEALRLELLSLTATGAATTEFLAAVLPGPLSLGAATDADAVRRQIAERLLELGLTVEARAQLSDDRSVPVPEDRMLYARAYLAERRPDLVIGYLAGLEDPAARTLRAAALELSGSHDAAATIHDALGDEAARDRALWRARNWAGAAAGASGIEAEAAALASAGRAPGPAAGETNAASPAAAVPPSAPDPNGEAPATPLETSRALLDRSAGTRRVLRDLLAAGRQD